MIDPDTRTWRLEAPPIRKRAAPLLLELFLGAGFERGDAMRTAERIALELERAYGLPAALEIPEFGFKQSLDKQTLMALALWGRAWARACWEEFIRRAVAHAARAELTARGMAPS